MNNLYSDFSAAFRDRRIWIYLSKQDIKSRFRRSRLGLLWLVIHQLSFSLFGGLIWAAIFKLNPGEFIPFITVGFAVWGFINGMLVDSTSTFIISHVYLKQLPINQIVFISRSATTMYFYLIFSILVAISLSALFGTFQPFGILYLLLGLFLLYLLGFSFVGMMSYLGIRFRDLPHAISGVMTLLFILSPVIYPPKLLVDRGLGFFVDVNPFTSIIEVIRVPIIEGRPASLFNYLVVVFMTVLAFVLYRVFRNLWGRKIAYWL